MAEYAYIQGDRLVGTLEIDPATHAAWVANGNPKAFAYRPVQEDPIPAYDSTTHSVDPLLVVEPTRVRRSWTVRPKTAEERRQVWTAFEFLRRFTWQERSAIRIAGFDDDAVADFLTLCTAAQEVVSDDPVTQAGMDYLVSLNLLTPARRAEILS